MLHRMLQIWAEHNYKTSLFLFKYVYLPLNPPPTSHPLTCPASPPSINPRSYLLPPVDMGSQWNHPDYPTTTLIVRGQSYSWNSEDFKKASYNFIKLHIRFFLYLNQYMTRGLNQGWIFAQIICFNLCNL